MKAPPDATELTTTQVSLRLGISTTRVRQLAAAGQLEWRDTPLGRLYQVGSIIKIEEARS